MPLSLLLASQATESFTFLSLPSTGNSPAAIAVPASRRSTSDSSSDSGRVTRYQRIPTGLPHDFFPTAFAIKAATGQHARPGRPLSLHTATRSEATEKEMLSEEEMPVLKVLKADEVPTVKADPVDPAAREQAKVRPWPTPASVTS